MDEPGPSDESKTENKQEIVKSKFTILKTAVDRIVDLAIPYHLQKLQAHCECIKEYQARKDWSLVLFEQVEASNVVRLLESDLYELRELSLCVKEEDIPLFQKAIEGPTNDVISAIAVFLEENSNAMQPVPKLDGNLPDQSESEFPALVCNLNEPPDNNERKGPDSMQMQVDPKLLSEPLKAQRNWRKLLTELYELNELFKKLSRLVFTEKESVDSIENNVQFARDNVVEGNKNLRRAVALQAATFPVAGAALGGLLLGPIGAVAGFKLLGSVAMAISGSVIGYGAGVKLKKKRQTSCDIEMKAITYSSKSRSVSTPELNNSSSN